MERFRRMKRLILIRDYRAGEGLVFPYVKLGRKCNFVCATKMYHQSPSKEISIGLWTVGDN